MYNNMRLVVLTFESQGAFQTQERFNSKSKQSFQQGALAWTCVKLQISEMCFLTADPLESNCFTITSVRNMDHFMQIWNFFPSAF